MTIRLGLAEIFIVASLAIVASVLTVAFLSGWTFAVVPGLTYALAVVVAYWLYRWYAGAEAEMTTPLASLARFRVVGTQGACLLGRGEGDVITVGPAGSVSPQLCAHAEVVLRKAATAGTRDEVKDWCCPVYDHMLVFRKTA